MRFEPTTPASIVPRLTTSTHRGRRIGDGTPWFRTCSSRQGSSLLLVQDSPVNKKHDSLEREFHEKFDKKQDMLKRRFTLLYVHLTVSERRHTNCVERRGAERGEEKSVLTNLPNFRLFKNAWYKPKRKGAWISNRKQSPHSPLVMYIRRRA